MGFPRLRLTALFCSLIAAAAILTACGNDPQRDPPGGSSAISTVTPTAEVTATEPAAETPTITPTASAASETGPDGREGNPPPLYDPALVRSDVDCSREFISSGGGEDFPEGFTAGHYVVEGILGQPCLGTEDPRLLRAWEWLRIVVPPQELDSLILFAGYEAESDLLAYVEALTAADGTVAFQMTVNLGEAERDDIELALTMAHEYTHVMTGVEDQLDRSVDESQCATYFEGEGCYTDDSYIARWIEEFWGSWIHEIDPLNPDDDAAVDRCLVDGSFLGSYAAINPEEDFAETFSAYVFDVPVDDPGLAAKYEFFEADPTLAKYRERVAEAGLEPLPNQFEGCGSG